MSARAVVAAFIVLAVINYASGYWCGHLNRNHDPEDLSIIALWGIGTGFVSGLALILLVVRL